jgi:hypothetical protein
MELIGAGRMAEVFAVDDDTVVKVDRPEFDGVALYEATILREVGRSSYALVPPVPRSSCGYGWSTTLMAPDDARSLATAKASTASSSG